MTSASLTCSLTWPRAPLAATPREPDVVKAAAQRISFSGPQARTLWQADDIDGVTRLAGAAAVRPGSLVDVAIESVVDDYDFQATLVRIISAPPAKPTRVRALPVLTASAGSYGR